ncbi:MAG: hypothetical protein N2037_05310 [Acidimicrobiales bacterium]|nr:hypothetical protein [Acidimicrobiales bacterium]
MTTPFVPFRNSRRRHEHHAASHSVAFTLGIEPAAGPLAVPRSHGAHRQDRRPMAHAIDPHGDGNEALCGKSNLIRSDITTWPGLGELDTCPVCDQLARGAGWHDQRSA